LINAGEDRRVEERDWAQWHVAYDDPDSSLARRLAVVRARIRDRLDAAPPGPLRVVSLCAGQGRDLLGVLAGHSRAPDVIATLVELDPRNVAAARAAAAAVDAEVQVVGADAAFTGVYAGTVPADLVLACGMLGNITDADVRRTIGFLPQFVAGGASVIWTRHRREPDLVPAIGEWFAEKGFTPVWLSPKDAGFGVGVHRFTGEPEPLRGGQRMFTFVR
jgi:hypothetical protein